MIRYLKKLLSSAMATIMIGISLIPLSISVGAENAIGEYEIKYNESDRVIVSLGDSFSSGEGIDKFYDYNLPIDKKVDSQDWLSHRSQNSWSGKLTLKDANGNTITMKDHRNDNWYFVAMSGAITSNILDTNPVPNNLSDEDKKSGGTYSYRFKEYGQVKATRNLFTGSISLEPIQDFKEIEPQLNIYNKLGNKKVDYVTMTMGGNDVDFVPVVTTAACQFNFIEFKKTIPIINKEIELNKPKLGNDDLLTQLEDIIDKKLPNTLLKLEECYKAIDLKSNKHAVILIAGYPRLFGKEHKGVVFDTIEIDKINEAVDTFNEQLDAKIKDLRENEGINIYFVPVADKFGDHGAYSGKGVYSDKGAYINSVYPTKTQDINLFAVPPISAYSMHPNEAGAKVYAECVQNKINDLEDNYTKIWGKVTDENGNPLDDVKVTLTDNKNHKYSTKKTKNGYYSFAENYYGYDCYYTVKYELSGYKTLVVKEEKGGKRITINTKLKKDDQVHTVVPTDAFHYNGHSYYIYSNIANTWNDAKKYCESLGGYLAVINNATENTALYNYMRDCGYESAYFGYTDSELEGNWQWVNNDTSDYTNWASGEPNNEEDCENYAMFYFKYTDGKWNDGEFNGRTERDTSTFICEWDFSNYENIAINSSLNDYWVVFREGYRNNQIEMSSFDVNGNFKVTWNKNLVCSNQKGKCNQYYFNNGKFEKVREYPILTDYATEIIASNFDIYDKDGNIVFKKYDSVRQWKNQYIDAINNNIYINDDSYYEYALAYVDKDDIPELICHGSDVVHGTVIAWINNNSVLTQNLGYSMFYYYPRQNRFYGTVINHGYYHDTVYEISGNSLNKLFEGTIFPKENGFDNSGWYINNVLTNEQEYKDKFNSAFDKNIAIEIENTYNKKEIIDVINRY